MNFRRICYNCMKEKPDNDNSCPYCGFDNNKYNPAQNDLPPLTILNHRYIIGRSLGSGDLGITYIAMVLYLQKVVAIKELFPVKISHRELNNSISVDEKNRECFEKNKKRLLQEAGVLTMLNEKDHEGVVRVDEYFEDNQTAYIVMEYLEGISLKEEVSRRKITLEETLSLMEPVITSLSKINKFDVVHMGVRPDNIMVLKNGNTKLLDFGGDIIRFFNNNNFDFFKMAFIPPELCIENGKIGSWTDVYAVAATIYFCLTGIKPADLMARKKGEKIIRPSIKNALLSSRTDAVIIKALEVEPADRYQTMESFWSALISQRKNKIGLLQEVFLGVAILAGVGFFLMKGKNSGQSKSSFFYRAEIKEGSGSGNYKAGEIVTIEADAAEEGYEFNKWQVIDGDVHLLDISSKKTDFIMPEEDIEVVADYEQLEYQLNVNNGYGSGLYKCGSQITIVAEEADGYTFSGWEAEGITLTSKDKEQNVLTIQMPAHSVTLSARYDMVYCQVQVQGGSGTGNYQVGEKVMINAEDAKEGYEFSGWKVNRGNVYLSDPFSMNAYFIMPKEDVNIKAEYRQLEYELKINNGNGSGSYHFGETVSLSADLEKDSMKFSHWTVDKGSLTISDLHLMKISFRMPAEDLTLTIHYKKDEEIKKEEDKDVQTREEIQETFDLSRFVGGDYHSLLSDNSDLTIINENSKETKIGNENVIVTARNDGIITRIRLDAGESIFCVENIGAFMKPSKLISMLEQKGYVEGNKSEDGKWRIFLNEKKGRFLMFKIKNKKISHIYYGMTGYMPVKQKESEKDIYSIDFSKASTIDGWETGFSPKDFLESVKSVYIAAYMDDYTYGSSGTLPPCMDEVISSDRLISRALWDLGMTDQTPGGETIHTLPKYLLSHGFENIFYTEASNLKPGDIVFLSYKNDFDRIEHPFVVVSYDENTNTIYKYDLYIYNADEKINNRVEQPFKELYRYDNPDSSVAIIGVYRIWSEDF